MSYNINPEQTVIFNRYFADIEASTSEFQKAILPLLNSDWDKNSELLITKLQSFADRLENDTYRECILATKDYINSRDFMVPNKYETTSYFYGVLQYNSESPALKNLNQKFDQLMQDAPQKNISWQESFENLWCKTASTLFSAFDFAKENPIATIAALLYGQTLLTAAFPSEVLELSKLNGANGFKIKSKISGRFGYSVGAGDINGDGYDDIIIGDPYVDIGSNVDAGVVYVIFGKANSFAESFDLTNLNGENGFKIIAENATSQLGWSVSAAGDINNDGYDDVIIGAIRAEQYKGSGYVIFGHANSWEDRLELSNLNGTNGFKLIGAELEYYIGYSVSSAGDINNDGYDDIVICTIYNDLNGLGVCYVVFGHANDWVDTLELSNLNGIDGFRINGEWHSGHFGSSASSSGDVNGDGYDDLVIGAPRATPNGKAYAGSSYVIFGKASGWPNILEVSSLNGTNGFKIHGEAVDGRSGFSVSSAGDINGDGYDDVIIGANQADTYNGYIHGAGYVIFGKANNWTAVFELSSLNGMNGFKIKNKEYSIFLGNSVSAGDINNDGYDDVIIGSPGYYGTSYVIFGKANGWDSVVKTAFLNGINGFEIPGVSIWPENADAAKTGWAVSATGDINGDNYTDIIMGAPGEYESSYGGRVSYVIFVNKYLPDSDNNRIILALVLGIGSALVAIIAGFFCYRKYCRHKVESSSINKKIMLIGGVNERSSPVLTATDIEMDEMEVGSSHATIPVLRTTDMQPSAPSAIDSYSNQPASASFTFFQPNKLDEQKDRSSKFNWEQTDFDVEFIEQAKELKLEQHYMCPVLERPMYDAVYIKTQGNNKLLSISDEAARDWLIKKKQTTSPIRNFPVEAVFIAADLREIIQDAIKVRLNQTEQPPAYDEMMALNF